jgi:endonuclease-3
MSCNGGVSHRIFPAPTTTIVNRKERARFTLQALRSEIPQPATELEFVDPYQLTVAVVLSAQCTDERVNMVTPELFEAYPTVQKLALAEVSEIYPYIKSISYPNNKSKHLAGLARKVVADFGGKIPSDFDDLVSLPGVGRKTAQVVASVAYNENALPVDTHIFRVANRIGLTEDADTPLKVERQLKKILPQEAWSEGHHLLILHGRYRCTARSPRCDDCPVNPVCEYYSKLKALPPPRPGLDRRRGRYWCSTRGHYFDHPDVRTDRRGIKQICCPQCQSMNVFNTTSGATTRRIRDYRV